MLDWSVISNLGLALSGEIPEKLQVYHAMLMDANAVMDLTNVPEEEMAIRHYADSLLVLKHGLIRQNAKLIDVGSGAGFPGLPLAIARNDLKVTLLESKVKRCQFLQFVADALQLSNVTVLCGRAEDFARGAHRERYDVAVARAVAPLNLLAEYLLPYVKVGGQALCWKGPAVTEEMAAGSKAAEVLGGTMGDLMNLNIPERTHLIQVIKKTDSTPKKYPRKAGTPAKEPLGQ